MSSSSINSFVIIPFVFLSNILNIQSNDDGVEHLVYPPKYSKRMYTSSHFCILCAVYAYYHAVYDISILGFVVLCCSVNYWRKPTFGYRRTIDIVVSQIALWYSVYVAYVVLPYELFLFQLFGIFLFAMSYFTAIYFGMNKNQNYASICHTLLHIIAITFNLVLVHNLASVQNQTI